MKTYYSPFNKIGYKKNQFLIFSGITGNIIDISFLELLKLRFNLLSDDRKNYYTKIGVLLKEPGSKYILRAETKRIKDFSSKKNISLVLLPTLKCNFKCSYCFVKNQLKDSDMSDEVLDKVLHLISTHGGSYTIEWFGGEPSLRPQKLKYFYDNAEKNNFQNLYSTLITNGSFGTYSSMWEIINKHINQIQITLDGPKEIHDTRRVLKNNKGSFDSIIKSLDQLYENMINGIVNNKIDVIIRCNINKENQAYYVKLREFILDRYNYMFRVSPAQVLSSDTKRDNSVLTNKEYATFIIELYKKYGILDEPYLPMEKVSFYHCRVSNPKSYVFGPNGNIYKCSLDVDDKSRIIGNCFDKTKLSNNDSETKYVLSTSKFLPRKCKSCYLLFFCWGGCAHYRLSKNMQKNCKFQKERFNDFLIIIDEIAKYRQMNANLLNVI